MTVQKRAFLHALIAYVLISVVVIASLFACFNIANLASKNNTLEGTYRSLFGATPIAGGNYSFSPPIPMYRAVIIGLESGGWNASSLENMTVYVSLEYDVFYTNVSALYQLASKDNLTLSSYPDPNLNMTGTGFETIHEVTAPVGDYQPQIFSGVACRYVWTIVVQENSGKGIPPPGYYLVDAATAVLIPTGPLI